MPGANNCKLYKMLSERFLLMFYSFIIWARGLWEAVPAWKRRVWKKAGGIKINASTLKTQSCCWGGSVGTFSNTVRASLNLLILALIKPRKVAEKVELDFTTHLKITIYKTALRSCNEQHENLIDFRAEFRERLIFKKFILIS